MTFAILCLIHLTLVSAVPLRWQERFYFYDCLVFIVLILHIFIIYSSLNRQLDHCHSVALANGAAVNTKAQISFYWFHFPDYMAQSGFLTLRCLPRHINRELDGKNWHSDAVGCMYQKQLLSPVFHKSGLSLLEFCWRFLHACLTRRHRCTWTLFGNPWGQISKYSKSVQESAPYCFSVASVANDVLSLFTSLKVAPQPLLPLVTPSYVRLMSTNGLCSESKQRYASDF